MPQAVITVRVTTPAHITITDVEDTLGAYWGYQATIPDPENPGQTVPNPETQKEFVTRKTAEFVGASYTAALATEKAEEGRQAGIAEAGEVEFAGGGPP